MTTGGGKHFVLIYDLAPDYLARRGEFRNAHLDKAWAAAADGALVIGGAFANPPDTAMLVFKGDSPAVAENFAASDPYVTNGLVTRWRVREWTTVAGDLAATPVRPQ